MCTHTYSLVHIKHNMSHKCMLTPVHFLSPSHTFISAHKRATDTHQREGSHVVDFEGVLRPLLLAVVNLQCGSLRVIAL